MSDDALIEAMARAILDSPLLQPAYGPWPERSTATRQHCFSAARAALAAIRKTHAVVSAVARPGEEYHEDMGNMLWWRFPIDEPPYAGMPGDSDWPGYHTHFTPIPMPLPPATENHDGK